ncbi:hypothetical protein P3T76_014527 [Phytophthora citrophthora]|uniref:Uncharacterized protein n=1 Tax=Phytophthora citrophthora TaxID=4793 RepID=A0AAD9G1D3_9STRA|nr:hypothetical protein P3T76_014527 [Phytophthora citrophthora]
MARVLEKISLPCYRVYDESLLKDLKVHDSDYLFVTKEKFHIQSKAAQISVLNAKALHQLHTEALEVICVFASTPAQRTVNVSDRADFWRYDY